MEHARTRSRKEEDASNVRCLPVSSIHVSHRRRDLGAFRSGHSLPATDTPSSPRCTAHLRSPQKKSEREVGSPAQMKDGDDSGEKGDDAWMTHRPQPRPTWRSVR